MARWHHTSCAPPDVFADGHKLQCRNCNNVEPDSRSIAHQDNPFSPLAIPPDEQVGQMNLWWPPSVPYSSKSNVEQRDADESESVIAAAAFDKNNESIVEDGISVDLGESQPSKVLHDAGATQSSQIYGAVLAADELRLLHLHAASHASSAIHASLEIYPDDDCPEYEAVSYTWGGEDGDSTPRSAIYVGSYWDILLQTTNCWNMLQYLRPQSGTRIVWVDAVGINQNSTIERAQQVAKMGSIYRHCLRVLVYLGPDIVFPDSSKRRHPSRRGLHEFNQVMKDSVDTKGTTTLRKLFTRRYFSRVWVIQELVLARSAVIPVGHTQFWASNVTPTYLASSSTNNSTPFHWNFPAAPWTQFIGRTFVEEGDVYDILRHTWRCKASDPRDRIFGILGLLKSDLDRSSLAVIATSSKPSNLTPSYEISTQHVFAGFFAHILKNLGVAEVLMSASGLAARPGCPSWVPDWQGEGHLIGEDQIDETHTTGIQPPTARLHATKGSFDRGNLVTLPPLSLSPVITTSTEALSHDLRWVHMSAGFQRFPVESWKERKRKDPKIYDANSWCRGASVDPSTGALSTKLRHLVQFNAAPVLTEVPDLYEVVQDSCSLYIMTQKGGPPLNILVPPGRNHLFYLEKEYGEPAYLLLFLQELNSESPSLAKSFKLILCCAYADIFFGCPLPTFSLDFERSDDPLLFEINLQESLYTVISKAQQEVGGKEVLLGSLSDALKDYRSNKLRERECLKQLFPCDEIPFGDVIDVLQACLNEFHAQTRTFKAYIQCLGKWIPQCHVQITHGWIVLTLTPKNWATYRTNYSRSGRGEITWRWSYAEETGSWDDRAIFIRAELDRVIRELKRTSFYEVLAFIKSRIDGIGAAGTGEDEATMLKRGPQFGDHCVPIRRWPSSLVDSFAADGVPWQVRIV
ncbi:heterokaryon incompatibility HET-6 protein [Rhypophila decipiens]|uniref:Heterokaryon incompatibility HET-6 protein n=1 Tax=Rhypophila decipiens TaxID=261697 RepID=A0AAN6XV47_9PEZI|nr:heterokaryon incompatibility HET-6 protein [Rhypophila decipiens]